MDLRGYEFYKTSGAPVSGALAEVWDAVDGTPGGAPITSITTSANGQWEFLGLTDVAKDVRVTFTGSIRWYKGLTKTQATKFLVGASGLSFVAANPVTDKVVGWDAAAHALTWGDGALNHIAVSLDQTQTLVSKTLTTPTIAATGFANANHAHAAANSGGQIPYANITGTPAAVTFTTISGYPGATGTGALVEQASPTINTPTLTDPQLGTAVSVAAFPQVTTGTVTLPAPLAGHWRTYKAYGGTLTINSNAGSQQVNPGGTGAVATLVLANGDSATFYSDGTLWYAC